MSFWNDALDALADLGNINEIHDVRYLCRAAEQAAYNLQWTSEFGTDEEVASCREALFRAEAAAWRAAFWFTPPSLPPRDIPVENLSRLRSAPVDRLRPLRAVTGELIVKQGDSNTNTFSLRGTGEEFKLQSGVVNSILATAPAPVGAIKWYEGTSSTGLIYSWVAPVTAEAITLLRLEAQHRKGIPPYDLDPFVPMHPVVRTAWEEKHTTWTPPNS